MKKVLVLVLCLSMVFSLLTGCSTTSKETEDAANTSQDEGVQAEPTKEEEPQDAKEEEKQEPEKVEINVMMSIPRFTEQMEQYFEQFKEKMLAEKNIDVTINLEMPSSDQYSQILQTRLASGEVPDLFALHAVQDIPTYYNAGYLMDMSNQPFANKLYEDVKETVTYDGKVVAVPMESVAWGYLYNKDIFEECNITPPDTLDGMKEAVDTLKSKGYTPFLLSFQDSWVAQLMTALSLGGYVSAEAPDWVDRMYEDKGSYTEVKDIFNIIDLIMENGTNHPFETGFDQGCADFANGSAAMWVNGTWAAESILAVNPDMKIGVGALPVNNDPKATMVNLSTSTSLAVYSGTKNAEVALELANYILDDKDSSALYQSMLFNPVASNQEYEQYSWSKEAYEYVADGRAYIDLVLPNSVTSEQAALLQEYYLKSVSQDDIIKDLDETYKEANMIAKGNE